MQLVLEVVQKKEEDLVVFSVVVDIFVSFVSDWSSVEANTKSVDGFEVHGCTIYEWLGLKKRAPGQLAWRWRWLGWCDGRAVRGLFKFSVFSVFRKKGSEIFFVEKRAGNPYNPTQCPRTHEKCFRLITLQILTLSIHRAMDAIDSDASEILRKTQNLPWPCQAPLSMH